MFDFHRGVSAIDHVFMFTEVVLLRQVSEGQACIEQRAGEDQGQSSWKGSRSETIWKIDVRDRATISNPLGVKEAKKGRGEGRRGRMSTVSGVSRFLQCVSGVPRKVM